MTKKDFDLIASIIGEEVEFWQRQHLQPPGGVHVLNQLVHTMKARFKKGQPSFDEGRFVQGAGLG